MRARTRLRSVLALAAVVPVLLVAACAPPEDDDSSEGGKSAATATSADEFGGMDALVAAAKKEAELNVIALPPDWANYGEIIKAFGAKYGIKVNSAQPDGSSQDEINAVNQLKGTNRAPDVLDIGMAVALANTQLFAPYKVATWDGIPEDQKESTGLWFQDYGGYMAVGYDSAKVPAVTSVQDLLKPEYKNKVALNGDPTQANAALNGVMMASLTNGGSLDDITPGVNFFGQLKDKGNFIPVQATTATVKSGETPVVFDWDYLSAAHVSDVPTWKVFVPQDAVLGGYYAQAINKDAAHPAAARLWEEFLFSDEGQNLWLKGGARPVRMEAMTTTGTVDKTAAAALPPVDGTPVYMSDEQATKAKETLASTWAKAIG